MTRILGALLAVVVTTLTVGASHWRLRVATSSEAMVRVSWSARPERVETCRRLSDTEYEQLPAHMRRRVTCEGTTARYLLEVRHNEALVAADTLRGGGLRHDRELYALREISVPAGPSHLTVRFVRLDSSTTADESVRATDQDADERAGRDQRGEHDDRDVRESRESRESREDAERDRRRAEAVPPLLVLDTTVTLAPRTVLLVTYGDGTRRLTAKTSEP